MLLSSLYYKGMISVFFRIGRNPFIWAIFLFDFEGIYISILLHYNSNQGMNWNACTNMVTGLPYNYRQSPIYIKPLLFKNIPKSSNMTIQKFLRDFWQNSLCWNFFICLHLCMIKWDKSDRYFVYSSNKTAQVKLKLFTWLFTTDK